MIRGSIKYPLEFAGVSVVIPGAKTLAQVEENVSSSDYNFNHEGFKKFKKENLI